MKIAELFENRVLTFSNLLTFVRILIVPLIAFLFYQESITGNKAFLNYVFISYMIMGFSDFFDGYLARLLNQESKLGQYLDPLADKIAIISTGGLLCYYKNFPIWLFGIVILRDVWMFIAASFLYFKRDVDVKPNIFGKIGVVCIAFSMLIYTFSFSYSIWGIPIEDISIMLVITVYFLSIALSIKTYSRYCFENEE